MRRLIGRIIEWFLSYKHLVIVEGVRPLPKHSYKDDAGFDLFTSSTTLIPAHKVVEVPADICIESKSRLWFEIKARSSTFRRYGLEVQDAVIDRGYRGKMFAIVYNSKDEDVVVQENERICQIVPHHLIACRFERGQVSRSARGQAGFGSSGR